MPARQRRLLTRDDYDSPWKEALGEFLELFLDFFYPEVSAAIDWSKGYQALDTHFAKIMRKAITPGSEADRLFQVTLKDGSDEWIYVHIEIQSQYDAHFEERMFIYYYRIRDRFRKQIVSLALLGDDRPDWRPDTFTDRNPFGVTCTYTFKIAKLLDGQQKPEELERAKNPFALVTLAHRHTQDTRPDSETRAEWKVRILILLMEMGLDEKVYNLVRRVIDWMMLLSQPLEDQVMEKVAKASRRKKIPFVSYYEQVLEARGEARGVAIGEAREVPRYSEDHEKDRSDRLSGKPRKHPDPRFDSG
jgi:hypothetical protein